MVITGNNIFNKLERKNGFVIVPVVYDLFLKEVNKPEFSHYQGQLFFSEQGLSRGMHCVMVQDEKAAKALWNACGNRKDITKNITEKLHAKIIW